MVYVDVSNTTVILSYHLLSPLNVEVFKMQVAISRIMYPIKNLQCIVLLVSERVGSISI